MLILNLVTDTQWLAIFVKKEIFNGMTTSTTAQHVANKRQAPVQNILSVQSAIWSKTSKFLTLSEYDVMPWANVRWNGPSHQDQVSGNVTAWILKKTVMAVYKISRQEKAVSTVKDGTVSTVIFHCVPNVLSITSSPQNKKSWLRQKIYHSLKLKSWKTSSCINSQRQKILFARTSLIVKMMLYSFGTI